MPKAIRPGLIVDQITTKTDKRFERVARMADAVATGIAACLAVGEKPARE